MSGACERSSTTRIVRQREPQQDLNMPTVVTDTLNTAHSAVSQKRVSWGAIFAGVAVALVLHLMLGVLGIAVGATAIDPMDEGNVANGLGIGAAIFFAVSAIIAMFAGGYTSGALAIIQDRADRTLHGLTTWASVTVLSFAMLASGVGGIIGGTASMLASGMETATEATVQADGSPVDRILAELRARGIDPQQEFEQQRQEMSQEEVEQQAREAADTTADAVAAAAWATFAIMLLGAIAAAVGANVGSNRPGMVARPEYADATTPRH
jgi:ElaB/YqjD/DUF883 family membrane-anchored ribosome-binding protein